MTIALGADNTVQLTSFGAGSIPPGTWQIGQLLIGGSGQVSSVCIDNVQVIGTDNNAVPFSIICDSEGFTAQAVFGTAPVTSAGLLGVTLQSQVQIAGFEFDIFDLSGSPIEILSTGSGLAGIVFFSSLCLTKFERECAKYS